MFLDMLTNEEKEWFMDLAIKAAESNGKIAKEETVMLRTFANEMKISPKSSTNEELKTILQNFENNSSKKSKRIVLFELIGILFADNEFDDLERNFLSEVSNSFEIAESDKNEMISEISKYSELFNEICKIVLN